MTFSVSRHAADVPAPTPARPAAVSHDGLPDLRVPMRDGVRLATDVYFPPGYRREVDPPLPTILERTPYGKTAISRAEIHRGAPPMTRIEVARYFAARGYAVVMQDCRGRYDSEGRFEKYLAEGPDGFDTMAWIAAQPWSDGRVGTMGLSYAAHTQLAAACLNPPALTCMALDSGGFANGYHCGIRQGGAFELKQATWAFNRARNSAAADADPLVASTLAGHDLRDWFARMPWRPGHSPLARVPEYETYLFEQWTHDVYDDYWRQPGICAEHFYDTMRRVPAIWMSSWYDAYVRSTLANFQALSDDPAAPAYLIMGPWLHGDRNVRYSGDVDFGAHAAIDGELADDWLALRARWFERWLKPATAAALTPDIAAEPVARIFVMGGGSGRRNAEGRMSHGGRWIGSPAWPLPGTQERPFYLCADGRLSDDPAAAQAQPTSVAYAFDPSRPVPTIGGALTSGAPVFDGGAFDQRELPGFFGVREPGMPLAARPDVLVFQTPPLEHELAVIGPIRVRLWISSDAPDTDFTAKLIDVCPPNEDYPDGYAMNLTDGIFRCRFHASWEAPATLEPGRVYEIEIEPFATANRFARGHRIRVDISSSNFPHFDVNPNSGEAPALARAPRVAVNRVWFGAGTPSQIVLPIVDTDRLDALALPPYKADSSRA
ncbi:CocE/NonD family hydrolase [Burkholderia gladioli]|uniref:CocE/NonD family hydrolase n=1 Tax=Burkholderia gladioli TaxID=28095 RepID=UPI001640D8A1